MREGIWYCSMSVGGIHKINEDRTMRDVKGVSGIASSHNDAWALRLLLLWFLGCIRRVSYPHLS
jgi:hypothetical protein